MLLYYAVVKDLVKLLSIVTGKAGNSSHDKYDYTLYTHTNIMIHYRRRDGKTEGKWYVLVNVGGTDKVL